MLANSPQNDKFMIRVIFSHKAIPNLFFHILSFSVAAAIFSFAFFKSSKTILIWKNLYKPLYKNWKYAQMTLGFEVFVNVSNLSKVEELSLWFANLNSLIYSLLSSFYQI